jgi:hypothetical protein
MAGPTTSAEANGTGQTRPYAASWLDRLQAWVKRLPGPSWLYYAGLGLALVALQAAVLWAEGAQPIGTLVPAYAFIVLMMPLFLALAHWLDGRASAAFASLRPALAASNQETESLHYQLTTLPARPALLVSLGGVAFIATVYTATGAQSHFEALSAYPISRGLVYGVFVVVWWFIAAFLYHTIHQLRAVHIVYTRHTRVNLYGLRPLYGLSGLTALTSASLAAIIYGWMAINPELWGEAIALAIVLPLTLLALVTFVWPLLGIHGLLVEEKGRLLDECSFRLEAAIAELHRRVDDWALEGMDDLNKAIASLELELNLLEKIPTWPWRPDTVRLLLTALALPLGLWLVQYVLQRVIGP